MRSVAGIGVVGQLRSFQRERPIRQVVEIADPRVRVGQDEILRELAGRAGCEQFQVLRLKRRLHRCQQARRCSRRKMRGKQRKVQCWRGQFGIGLLLLGSQTDEVFGLERLYRFKLLRQRKVRARRSVSINDAFRQQVRNSLAFLGNVRTENVIERAVLTNENNNVLNRRLGFDLRSFAAFYRLGFFALTKRIKVIGQDCKQRR